MIKKNVLIVGGSKGIGLHISKSYLSDKYEVYILSRTKNNNDFDKNKHYICDVTNEKDLKKILEKFNKRKILMDIIIHVVGGSQKVFKYNDNKNNYFKVWNANLGYSIDINNNFIPSMIKKKWGRIIHLSASPSFSASTAYSSAKSALNSYVKNLAEKLIKNGIVISCVSLGPIDLPNRYLADAQKKNNNFWKNFKNKHLPIGRLAKPEEIIPIINFLSSDNSSYCSGAIWNVDGSII